MRFSKGAESDRMRNASNPRYDWGMLAYLTRLCRALDRREEEQLVPERKVLYPRGRLLCRWSLARKRVVVRQVGGAHTIGIRPMCYEFRQRSGHASGGEAA